MTMAVPPEVELQLIASGPTAQPWITIANIKATPGTNTFTVTFDTDVACLIQMDYWSHNDPSIPPGVAGIVTETPAKTQHSFTIPTLPAGNHSGYYYGFSLRLDANDVSGYQMRSQQGWVRLIGARSVAKANAVNVRFFQFGGTPPAPAGGGPLVPAPSNQGNWNQYTWAQWNPKNQAG